MQAQGIHVNVCRNSVVDARPDLHNVHPRGWAAGAVWDTVPGATIGSEIYVAVTGHGNTPPNPHVPPNGEGHGSPNVVFHEVFHGIDHSGAGGVDRSTNAAFNTARTADLAGLSAYEQQPGAAGQQETYADSAAGYYADPAAYTAAHPHLGAYWAANPTATPPAPHH